MTGYHDGREVLAMNDVEHLPNGFATVVEVVSDPEGRKRTTAYIDEKNKGLLRTVREGNLLPAENWMVHRPMLACKDCDWVGNRREADGIDCPDCGGEIVLKVD